MKTCLSLLAVIASVVILGCEPRAIAPARVGLEAPAETPQAPQAPASGVVEIGPLPASVDAFATLRKRLCTTPEGAAAAMVAVLLACNDDERTGMIFATMLLHADRLRAGRLHDGHEPGQHARDLLRIARRKPFIARSYLMGATPANGYAAAMPLRVRWQPHAQPSPGPDQVRLLLTCSGADRPRPITLKRGPDGLWTVDEFSSLCVGVRPPQE